MDSDSPRDPATIPRGALPSLLLVNFINALGFSLVLPFLVFLVTAFGGDAVMYGIIAATYPAFQLIGAPWLGKLSDQFGRRKILLISQFGTLFSWLVLFAALVVPVVVVTDWSTPDVTRTLTVPLILIFLARAFDGLTGGNVSVANAYLADISDDSNRSRNFGRLAISANLGFVFGPLLAGALGTTAMGEKLPVLAAILISAVACLMITRFLPETLPCTTPFSLNRRTFSRILGMEPKDCMGESESESASVSIWTDRNLATMIVLYFMIFLGFSFFYTAFPVHATQTLNWPLGQLSVFFAALGLTMALAQGPLLQFVSRFTGEPTRIVIGGLILGSNFLVIWRPELWATTTGVLCFAIGNGLMWPSFNAVLADLAGAKRQGAVQGIAGSAGSLGSILGLLGGGALYSGIGSGAFTAAAITIYAVVAVVIGFVRLPRKPALAAT